MLRGGNIYHRHHHPRRLPFQAAQGKHILQRVRQTNFCFLLHLQLSYVSQSEMKGINQVFTLFVVCFV